MLGRLEVLYHPMAATVTAFIKAWEGGALCLHPTDTLPGLTFDPRQEAGLKALLAFKERPMSQAILSLVPTLAVARQFWQPLPSLWEEALTQLWPGPLSVIWQASAMAPPALVAPDGSIALRCPRWQADKAWMHTVLTSLPTPLPTTSVNKSGHPPMDTWGVAIAALTDFARVRGMDRSGFEGMHCPSLAPAPAFPSPALPSTLVRIHPGGRYDILRQGALGAAALTRALTAN